MKLVRNFVALRLDDAGSFFAKGSLHGTFRWKHWSEINGLGFLKALTQMPSASAHIVSQDASRCSNKESLIVAAQGAQVESANVHSFGGMQSVIFSIRGKQASVAGQFFGFSLGHFEISQDEKFASEPSSALHKITPSIVEAVSCPHGGQSSEEISHAYDSNSKRNGVKGQKIAPWCARIKM